MSKHITIIFLCGAVMMIFAPLLSVFQWKKKLGDDWNKISLIEKLHATAIAFFASQAAFYTNKKTRLYEEYYMKKSYGLVEIYIRNLKLFVLPLFLLFAITAILTSMGIFK